MREQLQKLRLLVCVAVGLPLFLAQAGAATVELSQLDFTLDGVSTLNTDWGAADLTFVGASGPLYFNLSIDGSWQVQNVPVASVKGPGITQTTRFRFDLGNAVGVDVTEVTSGFALTDTILAGPPPPSRTTSVGDDFVSIWNGASDVYDFPTVPAPAESLVGGLATYWPPFEPHDIPNQACGPKECVPAAVSNSLKYLNGRFNLWIPDDDISIANMKEACGWVEGEGCHYFQPSADTLAWWQDKDAYMQEHNIPITTRKFEISEMWDVVQESWAGQDVEMVSPGHTAMLTGIVPLGDDRYGITIVHDPKQRNNPNDPIVETAVWNKATNKVKGIVEMKSVFYFIVECPEQTSPTEDSSWGGIKGRYR